ncbi:MAG TPA: DUF4160 domain-containing protein [Acidobacteriota bacterium]|nr:DUF4160 domain-containing protein [Acidobacteriota bacterium]
MPTVKDIPGPHRFYFYSFDCNEPVHVHVQRERMICKFWLEPIVLAQNHGFSARELSQIRAAIQLNLAKIQEAWREHCG